MTAAEYVIESYIGDRWIYFCNLKILRNVILWTDISVAAMRMERKGA